MDLDLSFIFAAGEHKLLQLAFRKKTQGHQQQTKHVAFFDRPSLHISR